MSEMWMVRGDSGRLYEDFRERRVAAIGWGDLADQASKGMTRRQLRDIFQGLHPNMRAGSVVAGASQVWRFLNEITVGDSVVTYSPSNRSYLLGTVTGDAQRRPDWDAEDMGLARAVDWKHEFSRDGLSPATRNSLGSTLTVFLLPDAAADEVRAITAGAPVPVPATVEAAEEEADPLADVENQAIERIKDLVAALEWNDMQDLIAGILRAMGYKTQVSPPGADRGRDIIASPDGFGFENPRIVVEVKHRKGQMGSPEIRSFLGGRHSEDRGLYVSTGGFSKDAYYEADRAKVPLSLWTLDSVVRALVEHYDATDSETKRIVPLRRMYWPA